MHASIRFTIVATLLAAAALPAAATTVTLSNGSVTETSQYVAGTDYSPQVHVIGFYDGGSSAGYSNPSNTYIPGTTQVNVEGSTGGPVSLVLSSYEATQWVLTGPGVGALTSILLSGYKASRAIGIDPSKVIDRSGEVNYLAACGYGWPTTTGGCDTPGLVSGVDALFGVPISSFTGRYSTSSRLGTVTSVERPAEFQVYVQLSQVPLPAGGWLLATGIAGLVARRWRTSRGQLPGAAGVAGWQIRRRGCLNIPFPADRRRLLPARAGRRRS